LNYLTPGAPAGGIWTDGKILVMHRQAQLPPNCIKCNAPGDNRPLKRNLTWHAGWAYLIILLNLIIYIIVAAIISSRATIYVGLCPRHRARRRLHMMIAWILFIASIAALIAAANVGGGRSSEGLIAGLMVGGFLLLLTSLIWAVVVSYMIVSPKKMDAQYIWLKGAGPEYLAQFPPMPTGPQVY
jgi:hypothetical protein